MGIVNPSAKAEPTQVVESTSEPTPTANAPVVAGAEVQTGDGTGTGTGTQSTTTDTAGAEVATEKKKRGSKPKADYAGTVQRNAAGKLESIPADFDSRKHKPLKPEDFANPLDALELKARSYDLAAKKLRDKIASGNVIMTGVKDKKKATKFLAMKKRMEELAAELAAEGDDVSAILASLNAAPGADAAK